MNRLLTVKEVAERLKVSPAMIYLLCSRGRMPHVRVGIGDHGTIRIEEAALAAFVEANRVQGRPNGRVASSTPSEGSGTPSPA